jgi:hypothetical protein
MYLFIEHTVFVVNQCRGFTPLSEIYQEIYVNSDSLFSEIFILYNVTELRF